MDQFAHCPRCESRTLERLQSYSHCIDCFYFEDRHYDSEAAYFQARVVEAFFLENEGTGRCGLEAKPRDQTAFKENAITRTKTKNERNI